MRTNDNIAFYILDIFNAFSREFKNKNSCAHSKKLECNYFHFNKIKNLVAKNNAITFILPAFPAKSPNHEKTTPPNPDLGEKLSLIFLNSLCNRVADIYPSGARIIICSDGRVFNDLVQVTDDDVSLYSQGIKNIALSENLTNISFFDLNDYYKKTRSFESMREKLTQEYGEPLEQLKIRVQNELYSKILFNGVHRFIFEDYSALSKTASKNKIKKIAKTITYQLIQRSNAWSALLLKKFPEAVRLSIHPQYCGSEKLGIMLLKSKDCWATPWHRIVLYDGSNHILMRKSEAEKLGAIPIYDNNQFSYYRV